MFRKPILLAVFVLLLSVTVPSWAASKTIPVIRFRVSPAQSGRTIAVQASFRLQKVPAFRSPYLTDFGQLQDVRVSVGGTGHKVRLDRQGDTVVFKGLPRIGEARIEYTLGCVGAPAPGYRKRLMGGPGFVLARAGLLMAIPGREEEPVEVVWDLPDGWQLGMGHTGLQPWAQTQQTIWLAGSIVRASVNAGEKDLQIARVAGVEEAAGRRVSACAGAVFRYAWRAFGALDGDEFCLGVLPRGSIGGGTALGYALATEENPVTAVHELLHWWTNDNVPAWFREGVHEYMAPAVMLRMGLLKADEFEVLVDQWQAAHARVVAREGRLSSLAETSRDYDSGKGGGDIYGLAPLFAFRLDREIRKHTGSSLEDVFAVVCRTRDAILDLPALVQKVTGYDPGPLFEQFFHAPVSNVQDLLR